MPNVARAATRRPARRASHSSRQAARSGTTHTAKTAAATANRRARGCPCPGAGLWEQAKPRPIRLRRIGARRSAADRQRAEAWGADVNVRRRGRAVPSGAAGKPKLGTPQVENLRPRETYGHFESCGRRTFHRLKTCAPAKVSSGLPVTPEPAFADERSQDGEASQHRVSERPATGHGQSRAVVHRRLKTCGHFENLRPLSASTG